MKKTMILIAVLIFGMTACKKKKCLKQVQLQEELDNNSNINCWSDLINKDWYKDSLTNNYFSFNDSQKLLYFSTNKVSYEWRKNHQEIIINFDSTILNSIGSSFDTYLIGLLTKGVQNDVLELLSISKNKALLYSRELSTYINLK